MKKEDKLNITKNKLIDAAYKLMHDCDDPAEVTSRAIASEAGVKLAMINYCFGAREALLLEAARRDEQEYLERFDFAKILRSKKSPKEKIRQMHYAVADYLINSYKFTKAVTGYVLLNRDLTQGLNSLPLVEEHFKNNQINKEEWELKLISYQLSSMTQLIIYRLDDMSDFLGKDVKKDIREVIDLQIDMMLPGE